MGRFVEEEIALSEELQAAELFYEDATGKMNLLIRKSQGEFINYQENEKGEWQQVDSKEIVALNKIDMRIITALAYDQESACFYVLGYIGDELKTYLGCIHSESIEPIEILKLFKNMI